MSTPCQQEVTNYCTLTSELNSKIEDLEVEHQVHLLLLQNNNENISTDLNENNKLHKINSAKNQVINQKHTIKVLQTKVSNSQHLIDKKCDNYTEITTTLIPYFFAHINFCAAKARENKWCAKKAHFRAVGCAKINSARIAQILDSTEIYY